MGNVSFCLAFAPSQGLTTFAFRSGCRQERTLVRPSQPFDIFILDNLHVWQFNNYRGNQDHAEIWACVIRYVLL